MADLFNDTTIAKHFTLNTLEGPQAVDLDKMLCMGTTKADPWQQSCKRIIEKYDLESITPDGWLYFFPKPGTEVLCYRVTDEDVADHESKFFHIYAGYGTEVFPDGVKKYLQTGEVGDYILKNETDFWIVKNDVFNITYELKA